MFKFALDSGDEQPKLAEETALVRKTYDKHHLSVVRITRSIGNAMPALGTGFVVNNDQASCLILTCYHVIKPMSGGQGNPQVLVKFEGVDTQFPAEVLHDMKVSDLALLRVRGVFPNRPLEFSDDTDLSGRDVVLIGYFGLDSSSALDTPASPHGTIM